MSFTPPRFSDLRAVRSPCLLFCVSPNGGQTSPPNHGAPEGSAVAAVAWGRRIEAVAKATLLVRTYLVRRTLRRCGLRLRMRSTVRNRPDDA